jgi:release factor glutamine methyltransferase
MRADPTDDVVVTLRRAGCVAAEDEAHELVATARASGEALDELVARRVTGEPLAWITRRTRFCGIELRVDPGTFVPRWQSEGLARAATALLPADGVAVDLCTGSGCVAVVLATACPDAVVVATELAPIAAECARRNRVRVLEGDLFAPLPEDLRGRVDVLTAIAPYVPRSALDHLPRDVVDFEPAVALDGGSDGLDVVRRIIAGSSDWVRPGGSVLLEVGSDQCAAVARMLERAGFVKTTTLEDPDGDRRGVSAQWR